jgi:hypothetical protein
MNGIMPGPLWLAIASAVNSTSTKNRTLSHYPKSDTVTGEKPSSSDTTSRRTSSPERKA